jgi:uncharacterized protein (DUF4213/DUF364 family)
MSTPFHDGEAMGAPRPFFDELLELVVRLADCFEPPRVRALTIPRATEVGSGHAEFCALELDDGSLGLAYVSLGDTLRALASSRPGATVAGLASTEVAGWYGSTDPVRRTLGFAAISALSQSLFRRAGYSPEPALDSVGTLAPGPADHLGMIGLFPSLVEPILSSGARLTVLELAPELVTGDNPRYRVTLNSDELRSCNKVISTATVLLNDTLDGVLAACRGADYLALIGPTAGCFPDPLFARGVHALGGTTITDPEGFRAALQAGEKWGRYARKHFVSREQYPGIDALVAKVHGR